MDNIPIAIDYSHGKEGKKANLNRMRLSHSHAFIEIRRLILYFDKIEQKNSETYERMQFSFTHHSSMEEILSIYIYIHIRTRFSSVSWVWLSKGMWHPNVGLCLSTFSSIRTMRKISSFSFLKKIFFLFEYFFRLNIGQSRSNLSMMCICIVIRRRFD